jgi:hypothetical protein
LLAKKPPALLLIKEDTNVARKSLPKRPINSGIPVRKAERGCVLAHKLSAEPAVEEDQEAKSLPLNE